MLTDLMLTGKASIKAFGMSMLKMIAEVVNRLMVAYAVQAARGGSVAVRLAEAPHQVAHITTQPLAYSMSRAVSMNHLGSAST